MKLFKTFSALRYAIIEARDEAKRAARVSCGNKGILKSRGTWFVTLGPNGLCSPMPENWGSMKDITGPKLNALIKNVTDNYPLVKEIHVCGGFDWAESPYEMNNGNYDAWVSDWAFSVWKRDAAELDARYTIGLEWVGAKTPHYVTRFCGEWLGSDVDRDSAYDIGQAHKAGYRIKESETQKGEYRVIAPNGEESQLYKKGTCEEIVLLAFRNALLGSFGLTGV